VKMSEGVGVTSPVKIPMTMWLGTRADDFKNDEFYEELLSKAEDLQNESKRQRLKIEDLVSESETQQLEIEELKQKSTMLAELNDDWIGKMLSLDAKSVADTLELCKLRARLKHYRSSTSVSECEQPRLRTELQKVPIECQQEELTIVQKLKIMKARRKEANLANVHAERKVKDALEQKGTKAAAGSPISREKDKDRDWDRKLLC
jgi:excinuclease UvrABC ATPase subunit